MNELPDITKAAELKQLSNFLTYRVSRLHGKLNAQATKILNNSVGITLNQWRMIAFIGGAQQITASQLISITALDKGLVSRNIKSLIEAEFVVSTPHETDSRVHLLKLTASGKKIYETALPRMRRRQADLQKDISADDIEAFLRVINALEAASEDRSS